MTIDPLNPLFFGPFALLAFLLVFVFAIATKRFFVAMPFYEASEKRVTMLEEENSTLNKAVIELTGQNAGLHAHVEHLRAHVEQLRAEVQRLREEVARLAGAGNA